MPGTVGTEGAADSDAPAPEDEAVPEPAGKPPAEPWGNGPIVFFYSTFLVLLVPIFLYIGRDTWFQFDDWDYLVTRKAGNLDDLLRPHNGHWEAIPTLVYRALFSVFGLRYLPFEFVSVVAAFVGVALLLALILRARTRPWIAISVVTLLVFFGDAQYNVAMRVTSITFVGFAVPLGLIQMMLADHDGPRNRRDSIGLAVAMVALLCSNVATVMIFAVGVAMLLKRGWRIALFHVGPPLVVFAVWFLTKGRHDTGAGDPSRLRPLSSALHFASVLVTGTFESFTRTHTIGGLLVVLFVVALVLVMRSASPERRREAIVPLALLSAGAFFAVETGLGRADVLDQGAHAVRQGHYLYAVAVLILPAFAFLAEEVVRRWRRVAPVLFLAIVVAIGAGTHEMLVREDALRNGNVTFRNAVLLIPQLPVASQVPRQAQPFLGTASPITMGWLLDTAHEGRMPKPKNVTASITAIATLHLSLIVVSTPATKCRPFTSPVTVNLVRKQAFRFRGAGVIATYLDTHGARVGSASFRVLTNKPLEWKLVNRGPALSLSIKPSPPAGNPPMVCD